MASDAAAPAPAPKKTAVDLVGGIYCTICHNTFHNKKTYDVHYYEHGIGRDQVVYTCVVCRKDIAGYPSFRGHCYTIHVIKDRFKCEICNKSFSKLTALNDHISTIHKFQCSFCKREFPSKKDLRLHKIMHIMTDTPSLQCMTCNEKVNCVEACEPHIDKHSVSVYTCPICNQKENEKTEAVDHLRLHFDEDLKDDSDEEPDFEPFDKPEDSSIDLIGGIICDTCKKIFKNRAELEQHYNIQHPNRMVLYTCIVCKSKYEKYSKFGNHCYEHISKNRFKCEQCPRAFSRLPRLVAHEATAHGPHPSPRQTDSPSPSAQRCQRCGLTLRARAAAARHLDVHRKKVFACPVCARPYAEKHLVMKHVSQHFEAVFHACKICGNLYNARNRLVEHAKSHADLKTYTCNYCEKGFTTQYKLRQHQNLHTGQRPHSCHACPKSFADYSNLCKHLQKVHKLDPRATRRSRDAAIKLSSKKQWSDDGEWAAPALLPGDGLRDAWLLAAAPPPAPAPAAHGERHSTHGQWAAPALLPGDGLRDAWLLAAAPPPAPAPAAHGERHSTHGQWAAPALLPGDGLRDAWLLAAAPPPAPAPAAHGERHSTHGQWAAPALLPGDGLRDAWLLAAAPPPAPAPAAHGERHSTHGQWAAPALLPGDGLRDAWLLAAAPPPAPAPAAHGERHSTHGQWAAPALLPGDGLRDAWLLAAAPPPAPAPAAHGERHSTHGQWAAPALLPGDGLRDAWLLAAAPPPAPAPAAHVESWSCGEAEMPREYGPDCAPEEALPAVDPRLAAPAFTHIARDITILY